MRRPLAWAVMASIAAAGAAAAQDSGTIASRVRAAPDGEVRMQYASRPGTCGDGGDEVAFRTAWFGTRGEGFGRRDGARCEPGPVRVTLAVRGGVPAEATVRVGGAWGAAGAGVTDLGVVGARDAAAYFLGVLPQLEGAAAARGRLLLPIVLADSFDAAPALLAVARDEARQRATRAQAAHWTGIVGDARVVAPLAALARGGERSLANAAAAALSWVPEGAGIPALVALSRDGGVEARRQAVFWLAQTGDAGARRAVRERADDAQEDARVREHALFALAHGEATGDDFAWLRAFYDRTRDDRLRKAVLMGMREDDSPAAGRWLLDRVRDPGASMEVRKAAAFWAGQRTATPTSDLVSLYRALDERALAEHLLFVLAQRRDDAALDALVGIVRAGGDPHMRSRALFWLGQKDDPRAERLIAELLAR